MKRRRDSDRREFSERHQFSRGVPEQKVFYRFRMTAIFRLQDYRNVEQPAAVVNLGYSRSLVGRLDSVEHIQRPEAELHQLRWDQLHVHLRQSARRLHANISRAPHWREDFGDLLRFAIEHVEIVAKNLD